TPLSPGAAPATKVVGRPPSSCASWRSPIPVIQASSLPRPLLLSAGGGSTQRKECPDRSHCDHGPRLRDLQGGAGQLRRTQQRPGRSTSAVESNGSRTRPKPGQEPASRTGSAAS